MNNMIQAQLSNIGFDDTKPTDLPNVKNIPVGSTEKQVKEEVDRLNQSIEEIRKVKEEIIKEKIVKENSQEDVIETELDEGIQDESK